MTRPFHFQQFTIHQEKTAMKVGFDAVLLGAWTDVDRAARILDIGTGTGVIALMLAQRQPAAQVDGIEIAAAAAAEAATNAACSPWPDRVRIHHTALQTFFAPDYDLIVCNPPFFAAERGTLAADAGRQQARQDQALTIETVIGDAARLLREDGRLSLIWPIADQERLFAAANADGFFAQRQCRVRSNPQKRPHRLLIQLGKEPARCPVAELTIEQSRHQYTAEFTVLTETFYLQK